MSVDLSPASTLAFPRPLTNLVKRTLVVTNPNSESVAFKVKTTAPKQYCVRPNSGRIEPGESVEVSVLLQPMRADPPPGAKCKDKFLVQSAIIDASQEHLALPEIWSSIEAQGKERISEQKIRCAYVDADDADAAGAAGAPHSPADETFDKSTLIDGSPNTHVNGVSPDATQTQFHQADTTLPSAPSPSSVPRSTPVAAAVAVQPPLAPALAAASVPAPSTPTPTAAVSKPKADGLPVSEVDRLKDEIRALKAELASAPTAVAGLRKRGGGVSEDTKADGGAQAVQQAVGGGVPIEVVAALCLGVFVMTYIFF